MSEKSFLHTVCTTHFKLIAGGGVSLMVVLDSPPAQYNSDDPNLIIPPMFKYPSDSHLHELTQ